MNVPETFSVPLVNVRKAIGVPSVVVPCTLKFVGFNSRMLALDVPLLIVNVLMSVVAPEPPKVLLVAPVNVMPAAAVLAFVLKSSVPLLVKLPPSERTCVVTVQLPGLVNVPPAATVTFNPTVRVRATAESHCKIPEVP